MESEGESFDTVLRNAQEIGFAESDIGLDIDVSTRNTSYVFLQLMDLVLY